jgi:hypothetical protein
LKITSLNSNINREAIQEIISLSFKEIKIASLKTQIKGAIISITEEMESSISN